MTAATDPEIVSRRRAALYVCDRVPRQDVHQVLDMLGLLDLTPPSPVGSFAPDTGLPGAHTRAWS